MNLGLNALPVPRPHPAQPQPEPGQVSECFMLLGPAAFDCRLVPVAAQQRQAGPVPGLAREQFQQAGIVPGNRIAAGGAVDGHCAT